MEIFRSAGWWGKACRLGVVVSVMGSLLLAGCASKYGQQTTVVQYYPECYAPIAQLRQEEKKFVKNVAAGAIFGALAGAVIGGAIGGGRGALAGAGAGLLVGAGVAAALTKYKQVQDDRKRRSYLSRDMAAEAATLDHVGLSAAMASKCYKEHFDKLLVDFKAGGMSKAEFQARALEIISGLNEIAVITKAFNGEASLRLSQYQEMLVTEAKKDNTELPPMQAVPMEQPAKPQPVQTRKAPTTTKRHSKRHNKKQAQQEVRQASAASEEKLLTQPHAELAEPETSMASAPTPAAEGPDVSTMPGVIAKRDGDVTTAVGQGPDPDTLPGVIARRDNYKAKADDLVNVQKETAASVQDCIAKAEAEGVEIPKSLKPKTVS